MKEAQKISATFQAFFMAVFKMTALEAKGYLMAVFKMAALEAKGYLSAYKELLFFLLAGAVIAVVLYAGVAELSARGSLFEPFTVGVVDHDNTPELIFVFDFFNEYVIELEFMEKDEALTRLIAGDIPAFVELPENFTRDVFYGINSPFTVHLNREFPLQGSLVQMLAAGGIAYLSASQAGVYAALGYALDAGISWEDVQSELLIPVNMAFATELIRHDDLFVREVVPLVDTARAGSSGLIGEPAGYFLRRFAAFWHMLGLLALLKFLPWYSLGIRDRFKLAGIPFIAAFGIKWAGLFCVVVFMSLPIMPIVGVASALILSVFVSVFGLLSGKLFAQSDGARGIFIFFSALGMYFASGGIIPYVFLPRGIYFMRWFSFDFLLG